jgi:hypothetical protein
MFDSTDQNQILFIYLFIQIQILIGFQPNRFMRVNKIIGVDTQYTAKVKNL